jgi:hypothetical protein
MRAAGFAQGLWRRMLGFIFAAARGSEAGLPAQEQKLAKERKESKRLVRNQETGRGGGTEGNEGFEQVFWLGVVGCGMGSHFEQKVPKVTKGLVRAYAGRCGCRMGRHFEQKVAKETKGLVGAHAGRCGLRDGKSFRTEGNEGLGPCLCWALWVAGWKDLSNRR